MWFNRMAFFVFHNVHTENAFCIISICIKVVLIKPGLGLLVQDNQTSKCQPAIPCAADVMNKVILKNLRSLLVHRSAL